MRHLILIGQRGRPHVQTRTAKRADGPDGKPMPEAETPMIVGYASVFYDGTPWTQYNLWGNVVERIMPGAFTEAIKGDCAALRNHNANMLLGRTTADPPTLRLHEDKIGLHYEIDPPQSMCGMETVESIRRGDMQGSSFAFRITKEMWSEEKTPEGMMLEVRSILAVELYDVGPVTFPAYEASTTGLRSSGEVDEARASYARWQESKRSAGPCRESIMARARVVELTEAGA